MTSLVRSVWDAPAAVPPPPRRVWRDWALVAVLAPLTILEPALRAEVPDRWLWAGMLLALVPTVLWRRTHPFTVLAVAYAAGAVASFATGGEPQLYTTAYFLLLLYALTRWGSGRAITGGLALVVVGWASSFVIETPTVGDALGGLAVVALTTTLGFAFRWRAGSRARELDRVRAVEREQIARDLHDTVAHHVSAIAIQAQAGSAVAEHDPDAAADVLRTIEAEAGRTLDEMRSMVRVLREGDDDPDLTPTPTLADLALLSTAPDAKPAVRVEVSGDLDTVAPATAAAAFRIAQEAVTNARRHAAGATAVEVTADVEGGAVHLEVHDDGGAAASIAPGYGITGMIERATLLGGTCTAGPTIRGWSVVADLPREGARP